MKPAIPGFLQPSVSGQRMLSYTVQYSIHIWGSVFIGRIYHKNIYDMMAFTERKIGYPSSTFVWYFSVAPSIVVVLRANSEKFHILSWLVMVENAYKQA
jgi:hypothetical protein